MRSKELLLAVKAHISEHLKTYSEINLNVFIHNLPVQEVSDSESLFPFVILRFDEQELNGEYTESTLVFALGVNDDSSQENAGLLLAEICDALTAVFYNNRITGTFFETKLPIKIKQAEPEKKWNEYHFSSMELTFSHNTLPTRPLDGEYENEGNIL